MFKSLLALCALAWMTAAAGAAVFPFTAKPGDVWRVTGEIYWLDIFIFEPLPDYLTDPQLCDNDCAINYHVTYSPYLIDGDPAGVFGDPFEWDELIDETAFSFVFSGAGGYGGKATEVILSGFQRPLIVDLGGWHYVSIAKVHPVPIPFGAAMLVSGLVILVGWRHLFSGRFPTFVS